MATRILQPSPGADTHLDSGSPTTNMSGLTTLQNYADAASAYRRVLLRFDLASLGLSGDEVVSGFVVLWNNGSDGGSLPASFDVHRVTADWVVAEATWNNRMAGTPWGSAGGDFAAPVDLSYQIASPLTADGNQRRLDLTELIKAWLNGTYSNYGLITIINPLPSATTWIRFRSSEHTTATQRPLLWIEDTASPIHLAPAGNGYYNQWAKDGFADAWRCILEEPGYEDTFTTRIRPTSSGQRQSWIVRSGVPANAVISAVRIRVNGATYSGGPTEIRVGFRLAGNDYWHASNISFPNNTYANYTREFLTNPATGQAWQPAQVNGIECIAEQFSGSPMGCISRSDVEVVFTIPTPPAAPTDLSATPNGANRIDLAWTDNAGNETGFKIERKLGAGGAWEQIDTVGANAVSYSDTTTVGNATYYYRVCAYNADGDSIWSNESSATAIQAPPTGLSVAPSGQTVNLTWTDNAIDESGYKVERMPEGGAYSQIGTAAQSATSYADEELPPGTYSYRVCAYNDYGDSVYSNEAGVTIQAMSDDQSDIAAFIRRRRR